MTFKVVSMIPIPTGIDYGKGLLETLDAVQVPGMWRTEDEIIANARDADALLCSSASPITGRILRELTQCRIVACLGIGYDRIDVDAATAGAIAVTNTPDYCLDEVSNQAIALMFALGKRLFRIDHAVRSQQKQLTPPNRADVQEVAYPLFRMRGQALGIIGLGKIGTATALKARGLGLRVIAYDPYVFGSVMKSFGVEPVDFDTLLREADFISIHAPLNDGTRGMIGYPELTRMKRTCYLINTARGGILDEEALIKALHEGLIAGAGLDVTATEPIEKDNPLLKLPNVILTGHSAWYSTASEADLWQKPMTQVVMSLEGKWPLYAVNPQAKESWNKKWAT
jgi:D-3-phosphoglycerate dehydrogenase